VGLDLERWERDFRSPEVERRVQADLQEAARRGIHAVPTLILNDRWVVQGAVPEEFLRRVIADLLAGRDPSRRS
jgi:predicted DsbA family dithiol-disulfide isomerase